MMRASLDGPIDPNRFVKSDGRMELLDLCMQAVSKNMHVLFLGEWDGTLCRTCVDAVRCQEISYQPPGDQPPSFSATVKRKFKSWTGCYREFFEYAEWYRFEELLRASAEQEEDAECIHVPPSDLAEVRVKSRASINAVVMWYFADPTVADPMEA